MGYDYYCTYCASKENNETVLFDMQPLLTGDVSKQFNIIKFRMTQKEVYSLANQTPADSQNRHSCRLSFQEVMQIIANERNLNDEGITGLTLQEVDNFLKSGITAAQSSKDDELEPDIFAEEFQEEKAPEEAPEEVLPDSIQHLLNQDKAIDNQAFSKGRLTEDLKNLQQAFIMNGELTFEISLIEEKDDQGRRILTGMNAWVRNHILDMANNRVCSKCGKPIFPYAGTAEHKSVVFIGYQSSGKTSTLLALTHYAINHMEADIGSTIWTGTSTLNNIEEVALLAPSSRLLKELKNYENGIAPDKTDRTRREDAYSATLLIRSRVGEKSSVCILTLTDLPGELCEVGGSLRAADIYEKFSVAMACDAFVVCLDTTTVELASPDSQAKVQVNDENGAVVELTPAQVIGDTCRWADEFQKILIQNGCKSMYVPMMLLFTKCRQLEQQEAAPEAAVHKGLNPIGQVYMFRKEQMLIERNRFYSVASDKFGSIRDLASAYHAMLRCSPYGYNAPARNVLRDHPELADSLQPPVPHNIGELMKWILCVFGCIPTVAEFKENINSGGSYILKDYYLTRPQHRQQNPRKGQETQEALIRCCLFANPGKYDKNFLKFHGQKARLFMEILMSKPNSNAM